MVACHAIDGIIRIVLSLDDDDIVLDGRDGITLLARALIDECHGSVLLLIDPQRVEMGRRHTADGDGAVVHGEHQHVLVPKGIARCRQQQTEVIELRTFVAALLVLVVTLGIDSQLQLVGLGIHLNRLEHGLPAFLLGAAIVSNKHGVGRASAARHNVCLCLAGKAWVDAGQDGNAQQFLVAVFALGMIRENAVGERDALRHAVLHTGTPVLIIFTLGIGKYLDGESLIEAGFGLCPTGHTLVGETVAQRIVVNHRLQGFTQSILCRECGRVVVWQLDQYGHLLSLCCQPWIVGNDFGNIGFQATSFFRVGDTERIDLQGIYLDGDIIQIDLNAIDHLPSAVRQLRGLALAPPILGILYGDVIGNIAVLGHDGGCHLFTGLRLRVAQRHIDVSAAACDGDVIIVKAKGWGDMDGVVLTRHVDYKHRVRNLVEALVDVLDVDI